MLAYFGVSRAEAIEPLRVIAAADAERLGLRCAWELRGEAATIRYSRP